MNERIRKFERESHIDVYALGKDRDKWEKVLSKFVELIVKDCRVALNPMLRDMISRGQAYELIKEHFGVENEGE
jgi:hypothetical protein